MIRTPTRSLLRAERENARFSEIELHRVGKIYDDVILVGQVFLTGVAIGAIWYLCVLCRA